MSRCRPVSCLRERQEGCDGTQLSALSIGIRHVKWALQLLVYFKNSITSTLHLVLWAAPLRRGQLFAEHDSKHSGELLKVTSVESNILSELSLLITWACWHFSFLQKKECHFLFGPEWSFWHTSLMEIPSRVFSCAAASVIWNLNPCAWQINPQWTGCLFLSL